MTDLAASCGGKGEKGDERGSGRVVGSTKPFGSDLPRASLQNANASPWLPHHPQPSHLGQASRTVGCQQVDERSPQRRAQVGEGRLNHGLPPGEVVGRHARAQGRTIFKGRQQVAHAVNCQHQAADLRKCEWGCVRSKCVGERRTGAGCGAGVV